MSDGRTGNFDIFRVDVDSGEVLPLVANPALDLLPTVSPDGRWVAFLSNRENSWQIWAVPLNGGNATMIAPVSGNLGSWTEQSIQWAP
jgi:TolB protein